MSGSPRHRLHVVAPAQPEDVSLPLGGEPEPFLEPGEYLAVFVAGHRTTAFGRPALKLVFQIVAQVAGAPVPGGTRLALWCRLGPGGHAAPSSKWARTWRLVTAGLRTVTTGA